VLFRYKPQSPTSFVDLRGEMADFATPIELAPANDGWLEANLSLSPGTYAYKLRHADGEWLLDPHNPRTRSIEGNRNSLLVVEGAEEPLLHASAAPWVHRERDGRVMLRAGLRRGQGERLELRSRDGQEWSTRPMRQVAGEDEHLLFEAALPGAGSTLEYLFIVDGARALGAPGGGGQAFTLRLAELDDATPEWWRGAILYTVFVDRFRRPGGRWEALEAPDARAGGDLRGLIEALPALHELGVTALHLTPLCPAPSAHRYDAVDPRTVDPALGGEEALVALLEAAHALELRVLVDLALTHVHRDHQAFFDVRRRGPDSPYWSWFFIERFPFIEGYGVGDRH